MKFNQVPVFFQHPWSWVALLAISWCGCTQDDHTSNSTMTYPSSRTETIIDTLWDVEVSDPYRWLEDDRSEETKDWVNRQAAFTKAYLDSIPVRQTLRNRFEKIFDYEKIGVPRKMGGRYFVSKNDGLQNQSVWYVRESLHGEDRVFLDPNSLSSDGTVTAYLGSASEDETLLSVIQSSAGSD